jgi:hypothetical protein
LPAADRPAAAYEFVEGKIREIGLASEAYGEAYGRPYGICG